MPQKIETIISASADGLVNVLNKASETVNQKTGEWADKFVNVKQNIEAVNLAVENLEQAAEDAGDDFHLDN